MNDIQCFKVKKGSKLEQEINKYFSDLPKWVNVIKDVNEFMGESITRIGLDPQNLYIDPDELKKVENKKLFTKDGRLKKSNLKRANALREIYKESVKMNGLQDFKEFDYICFTYGIYRTRGQRLERFGSKEVGVYFKANFDLEKRTNGMVEPITEIEYQETYLKMLKHDKSA